MTSEQSEAPVGVGTQPGEQGEGPRFWVNIEGDTFPWDEDEITPDQIRELGNLPEELPVLLIDLRTNEQRELDEDEVVELKPGMGFSKKISFKRGR